MKHIQKRGLWNIIITALLLTTFVGSCKKDKFEATPGVCPAVTQTSPINGELLVPLNSVISVNFNEKLDPATLVAACFELKSSVVIPGVFNMNADESSFTFTPNALLTSNTTFTGRVKTTIRDMRGNALQRDYIWSFSTGIVLTPVVLTTIPLNNATAVPLNQVISASFNYPMDPTSIKDSSFVVKTSGVAIAGIVSYADSTAKFTPSASLLPNTLYTATITTMVKTLGKGNMATNYTWSFTTAPLVPPTVLSTDPINNETGVVLNKVIKVKFSVPMNPLTIKDSSFSLKQGTTVITGAVTYTDTTASFTPSANLLPNTIYTATVTTMVKSVSGANMVSDYVWSFTTLSLIAPTVIATDPISNETGVVLGKNLTADFSTAMDPLTITGLSYTVTESGNPVAGSVSYTGTTATFNPSVLLVANKTYVCTITTLAKNVAGTAMASNYVWSFVTAVNIPPTVISTDPNNLAANVPLNKVIGATFSIAMDPLTITNLTYTVTQSGNPVLGLVAYSGTTATFTPSANLLAGTVYTCTITTGAKNLGGTAMASNYVWSFSTVAGLPPTVISTDPANLATNVLLNKVVTATFSTAMDPTSINGTTFTLLLGAVPVTGAVTYSAGVASFTPTANLLSGNVYTARVTTGAKNLAGVFMASDHVWTFTTKAPAGPLPPDLKSVARFGIIAGVGVSNNAGFSVINNQDVGISPGVRSSVTGFPPAVVNGGAIYASDDIAPPGTAAMLVQAKQDLTDAYLFAEAAVLPAPATISGDQGGVTLAPGIYKSTSTLGILNGNLTLDAQGDVNAVWIFQVSSAFTTTGGAGGSVILTNGAQAKNVYWQVGSSATIGDNTSFKGNLLVLTSITLNSNAVLQGRVLCRNGAVVLTSTNTINKP